MSLFGPPLEPRCDARVISLTKRSSCHFPARWAMRAETARGAPVLPEGWIGRGDGRLFACSGHGKELLEALLAAAPGSREARIERVT